MHSVRPDAGARPSVKLVVLQPSYLPWLGFFDQYDWSDVFVLYDDVQYDKNGWRNRNRILTANGPVWLTVPVRLSGRDFPPILEVAVDNTQDWRRKHKLSLEQAYRKAPFFQAVYPALSSVLDQEWERLIDLDIAMLRALLDLLGMQWKVLRSSELGVPGQKTERLIGLCRKLGATEYLTGDAARSYLDEAAFRDLGVKVHWHGYVHPQYRQRGPEFVPYMSVVDLLFHHGPESRGLLRRTHTGASQEPDPLHTLEVH